MIRILGIDPGGTTGLALISVDNVSAPNIIWQKQIAGGLEGFLNFHWDELLDTEIDLIVCESFTLREGVHGVDLSPTYIIGALEALYPAMPIVYQAPKMKPLCDDTRLKKMGFYVPARGHAMDAVRHVMVYLRGTKHMPTLELGWGDNE